MIPGKSSAKSKSRILNENMDIAAFDERFSLDTAFKVNESGNPSE